jgi:hypothetical protein
MSRGASGSVTVAALRHRPRQALLLVALSAVVTASAALGPLYARAVEQSVLRTVVADAPATSSTLVVTDSSDQPTPPRRLERLVRPALAPQMGKPVQGADVSVIVDKPGGGRTAGRARLASRAGLCAHLVVVDGRCATAAGEVLVSRRTAGQLGVRTGDLLAVTAGDPADAGVRTTATVVGIYGAPDASTPYWSGRVRPPATARPTSDQPVVPTIDDVLTPWATLAAEPWPDLRTHLDIQLLADHLTIDDVPRVLATTEDAGTLARTVGGSAVSPINELIASTTGQRDQARTVIPLLAVQLAVLGIVVLAFVCAAAAEQRRPEIALARLRGHGVLGAAGMLLRELGLLVLVGAVLGSGLGWLIAEGATRWWLAAGVRPELRPPVVLAVVASVVAGLLAIVAAATPTLRQPLTSLLRRVPPRASTLQVGLVEGAVVAAAAAGLITLLSGAGGGISLLAPGLLAIAGGLLLAQATIPTAGPLARVALRSGRVPWALAGLQIARRPALRRLIAIVTVACALLVFAVDAWSVSTRNRQARAEVEAGAPVVLTVDATSPTALRTALLDIDPKGRFATPVVVARSATPVGPVTTAVEPAAFRRIAQWAPGTPVPTARQMGPLQPPVVDPAPLPAGSGLEIKARWSAKELERPVGFDGFLHALSLSVSVTPEGQETQYIDLGRLQRGLHTYRSDYTCDDCVLTSFEIRREFGDSYPVRVSLQIEEVRFAGQPVDLGPSTPAAWQVGTQQFFFNSAKVDPGPPLTISDRESYASLDVRRGDVPALTPALMAGSLSKAFRGGPGGPAPPRVAPDLSGGEHFYKVVGRLVQIPRSGPRGVLTDLRSLIAASPGGLTTSYDVWLAADDPAREARLRTQLAAHGLEVVARDTTGAHVAALASEGPSLALRLAVLAGVVAVVLAAAVLVVGVATSGASRARDLAGLRLVGVPAGTVRRASVREHLVVAVLGVIAGTALGLVAAQAALPDIPLFARPDRLVPLALDPAWEVVVVTALGCLLLLGVVSVVVGRALAASAVPARLREGR